MQIPGQHHSNQIYCHRHLLFFFQMHFKLSFLCLKVKTVLNLSSKEKYKQILTSAKTSTNNEI